MKTYSPKPADITHQWFLVDARGQTLGRLASNLATILQGKHKAGYAAHMNQGDIVVVINAADIKVTGNKLTDKKYYHHTGYPGGIKEISLEKQLAKDPAWVLQHAVAGMLPKNRLAAERLKNLKVYAGSDHAHGGQTPTNLSFDMKGDK